MTTASYARAMTAAQHQEMLTCLTVCGRQGPLTPAVQTLITNAIAVLAQCTPLQTRVALGDRQMEDLYVRLGGAPAKPTVNESKVRTIPIVRPQQPQATMPTATPTATPTAATHAPNCPPPAQARHHSGQNIQAANNGYVVQHVNNGFNVTLMMPHTSEAVLPENILIFSDWEELSAWFSKIFTVNSIR